MIQKTTAIALVTLALALAGLGLVSLWTRLDWHGPVSDRHWARIGTGSGNLYVIHARRTGFRTQPRGRTFRSSVLGVLSLRTGTQGTWKWVAATVPVWVPVGFLGTYPAITFIRGPLRRRRRDKRNQCPDCGYDRTGNISGICPECGNALLA